ncbi:putative glutathionylspermidine synthase [Leishmania mexicana MHOM/GT/2001/U1103]|uniref:Glutathionylspermidine synthase n=1 Tax=Leishmania mexicana (strain MHOM/GT/2001/U1103) TaxID=929439 RepID=E9AXX3_LEIMU|nr:putative glutathionylspermidine synthase [Leishmania mexicana MHOM/GT/2001/U1103]CBZ27816.1 putative glutathionylspermidine synthase [Leishmania mexicana MHOM/GT/2001/U1103]
MFPLPHDHHYHTHHRGTELVPFDQVIGVTPDGLPVISNGNEFHFSNLQSVTPSYQALCSFDRKAPVTVPYAKLGVKWQCVEFARRYLASRKAVWTALMPIAADMWSAETPFVHVQDGTPVEFTRTPNRSHGPAPAMSDIIVWGQSEETPFGHVAIVTEVLPEAVRVAEQNQGFERWAQGMLYSREILMQRSSAGTVELVDNDPVLGWVTLHCPYYDFCDGDLADKFRIVTGPGCIVRQPFPKHVELPWLQPEERCDFYLKRSLAIGGNVGDDARAEECDVPSAFYFLDYDIWCRLGRAAHSLHRIAMAATAKVLDDADSAYLLEHYFGVPPEIHPLLRRSWEMMPPMCGRFDFGYDGNKVAMLEYNCDSSGALLECCNTQEKMAIYYGVSQGMSTGSFLGAKCLSHFARLMSNEKVCPKHKLIHFMIDDDDEERYTAMCMMNFAEKAGFHTKLCVKLIDFRYRDGAPANAAPLSVPCDYPIIVDSDGDEVLMVWKTWSWDTVLRQYHRQRSATDSISGPTLSDILLNNNICVIEPLWKAVTGSKAILPFMHALAPDHEHILAADFVPTKDIISHHYISKPINGRAGQNIMMFDPVTDASELNAAPQGMLSESSSQLFSNRSLAASCSALQSQSIDRTNECSAGTFFASAVVYQKRFFLKKFEGKYFPIFCGWMTDDEFGGVVVREDTSKITKLDSIVIPARVVRENVSLGVAYADEGET